MKFTSLLGVSLVLFATTAFAHDLTYVGPIKTGETKNVKVELPVGKLTVEVYSSFPDTKFNCQFQAGYGGIVFEQTNTSRCVSRVVIQSETTMSVSVKNLSKDADYKIWVHDQ